MILKGESAEEFNRKADEDYDEYEGFIARTTKDTIFLHYIN
jgi:hypothetical protein